MIGSDFMCKLKLDNIEKISYGHIKKLELVRNGDAGIDCRVYRLNYDECIKLFNYSKDEFELKRYHEYTKLNFSCAAMPKTLYLINNKFSSSSIKKLKISKSKNLKKLYVFATF